MSARRVVIARDSFISPASEAARGKHPAVRDGAIGVGTRLWSDDPIVLENPHLFVDEDILPGPAIAPAPSAERRAGPEWQALVVAHRKTGEARPNLGTVAERMGWNSEQPLRDLIHKLEFKRWRDVHAAVAAEPE